jgi:hypothetical protein
MDGALEFDEHGRESNSHRANNGILNTLAPATEGSFLWILSLSVQRKYLAFGESEKTHLKINKIHPLRHPTE